MAGSSVFLKRDENLTPRWKKPQAERHRAAPRAIPGADGAGLLLRKPTTASVIIGASKLAQIQECAQAQNNLVFSKEELADIDAIALG